MSFEGCSECQEVGVERHVVKALTVNVGRSIADVVLDSVTVDDEASTASSLSSARTWPTMAAEE